MLINKFIHRIAAKERLVQIEFDDESLFISLYPQALGFYFFSKTLSGFEKLAYFDAHLSGGRIIAVEQLDYKPVVDLTSEKIAYGQKQTFKIRLSFYKEAPNLTIKFNESQRHLFFRYIEKKPKPSIFNLNPEQLKDKESLIKNFEGVDKYLAQELNKDNFEKLKAILKGEFCKPKLVSILPMRVSIFAEKYMREYNSWNDLLADGIKNYLEQQEKIYLRRKRQDLIKRLERKIEKLEKRQGNAKSMQFYKITGELILTNMSKIKRGMENIKLFNPYTQEEMEIELDPAKNPRENAEDYFKKYKKLKRGMPKIEEQKRKLERQVELLKNGADIQKDASIFSAVFPREEKEFVPFRKFILSTGSMVYVGKNAKSNMELTFKFALPNDYFFHIRGYEGAHTILRPAMQKEQNIKKEDIEKAAAIAAYFSKAKKQKNVPVSYTQRKYLKKSKKGKLGTVILMRESVVFVDPYLPSDTQD